MSDKTIAPSQPWNSCVDCLSPRPCGAVKTGGGARLHLCRDCMAKRALEMLDWAETHEDQEPPTVRLTVAYPTQEEIEKMKRAFEEMAERTGTTNKLKLDIKV
jgi:hypothetical protein